MTIHIPEWAVAVGLNLGIPLLMCFCGWLMFHFGGHHGRWNVPVLVVAALLIFGGICWPLGFGTAALFEYGTPIFLRAPAFVKFGVGALIIGGIGSAAYCLKKEFLQGYAVFECIVGLLIAGLVMADVEIPLSPGEAFGLTLSLVLVVRGITNFYKDREDRKTISTVLAHREKPQHHYYEEEDEAVENS